MTSPLTCIDDLAGDAYTPLQVHTHGDRVIVSAPGETAREIAEVLARHDVDDRWIPVVIDLLVAAAHLTPAPAGHVNVPLIGTAS